MSQKNSKKEKVGTRVGKDGQVEMTIADSPLYLACEALVMAKAQVGTAKTSLVAAEKEWCAQMKEHKKKKVNHKSDIIQFVLGKTTDDHARFCKQ